MTPERLRQLATCYDGSVSEYAYDPDTARALEALARVVELTQTYTRFTEADVRAALSGERPTGD